MILMILLVFVLMFYLQGRRRSKKGASVRGETVSPAPDAEHTAPISEPTPPQLDDRRDIDQYRDSLARWRRRYLFLALLAFLAAVVLLLWAASEVHYQDRATFVVSVSVWLLLLAGIVFVGELTRRSLMLASVSKLKDDVDGA